MRVLRATFAAGVAALLGLSASGAGAQTLEPPRHRQGYYMALGVQALGLKSWEEGESLGTWGGVGQTIRLGQLLTRRFGLGLQIDFGGAAGRAQKASLFGLGFEAQWEILNHLSLRGGGGISVVQLAYDDEALNDELRGTAGAGYFLGLGYDWFPFKSRLTGGFALTPMFQLRVIPSSPVDAIVGIIGVELGYWTGLPRNQLDLPEGEAYRKP
jgi:hypothetical protein